MGKIVEVLILFWCSIMLQKTNQAYKVERYEFFMPNARPIKSDTYLCSPIKVDVSRPYYIIGFEPKANQHTVHHMLLYGCSEPGTAKPVWNCGEMNENEIDDSEEEDEAVVPCKRNSSIIYAWAKDAPMLKLPKDVGFKVGVGTTIRYLVLQIHYSHVEPFLNGGHTDTSGVHLYYTQRPMQKLAGVLLLGTGGLIMGRSSESMETACNITERKVLHPFAFRTHTHALGVQVSGYRVRMVDGVDHWTLLGRRNPQLPQMFYPIRNEAIKLEYGDYVAASCKMFNGRDQTVFIGSTGQDEMCNFYLMYWTDDGLPLQMTYCFTQGPPYYYWNHQFKNIPLPELIMSERYNF